LFSHYTQKIISSSPPYITLRMVDMEGRGETDPAASATKRGKAGARVILLIIRHTSCRGVHTRTHIVRIRLGRRKRNIYIYIYMDGMMMYARVCVCYVEHRKAARTGWTTPRFRWRLYRRSSNRTYIYTYYCVYI